MVEAVRASRSNWGWVRARKNRGAANEEGDEMAREYRIHSKKHLVSIFVTTMKRMEERHAETEGTVDASTRNLYWTEKPTVRKNIEGGKSHPGRTSILSKAISPPLAVVGLAARVLEQVDSELAIRRLVYLLKLGSCSKSDIRAQVRGQSTERVVKACPHIHSGAVMSITGSSALEVCLVP